MWVAICTPLLIAAMALVLQLVEACLDQPEDGRVRAAHPPEPQPEGSRPATLGVCRPLAGRTRDPALRVACCSACRGVPLRRSVST